MRRQATAQGLAWLSARALASRQKGDSRTYRHLGVVLPFCMADEPGGTSPWVNERRYDTYIRVQVPLLRTYKQHTQPP